MSKNTLSPFSGPPATAQYLDASGRPAFRVSARALTPLRARIAEGAARVLMFGAIIEGILYGAATPEATGIYWVAALLGPIAAFPIVRRGCRAALKKRTRIEITATRFSVLTRDGWQQFDRQLPHRLHPVPHDEAKAEAEQAELEVRRAQARGKIIAPKRYYGESFHIVYDYLGQRNDLLTVYGRKETLAILSRLKACDGVMDSQLRKGDGTPLTPEEEWGGQPGTIPENK